MGKGKNGKTAKEEKMKTDSTVIEPDCKGKDHGKQYVNDAGHCTVCEATPKEEKRGAIDGLVVKLLHNRYEDVINQLSKMDAEELKEHLIKWVEQIRSEHAKSKKNKSS